MTKLLGKPLSDSEAQLNLMVPITVLSVFFNNTPIIVVMIPIVLKWAHYARLDAQRLLIPLSFATILGGTCTQNGTLTNLVVTGLLKERYKDYNNF
jgi:Na+/H+ antiporter NhaD/arsenite permease-like protein